MEYPRSWPVYVLTCLVLVCKSSCHLCLLSPPQRGSMMGLNKQGSDDCILLKSPCGGRPAEKSSVILRAGQNFTVTFQKNLDHWIENSPGQFKVMLGDEHADEFHSLAIIKDMGEPSLHLYTVDVPIPKYKLNKQLVLQAVYVTNNPAAPPVFYQCSDVMIVDL